LKRPSELLAQGFKLTAFCFMCGAEIRRGKDGIYRLPCKCKPLGDYCE
jgi:hypothetical protein